VQVSCRFPSLSDQKEKNFGKANFAAFYLPGSGLEKWEGRFITFMITSIYKVLVII
jgi:hypothetical protein